MADMNGEERVEAIWDRLLGVVAWAMEELNTSNYEMAMTLQKFAEEQCPYLLGDDLAFVEVEDEEGGEEA